MTQVTIYGASDDLIEFEGAIRGEAYLSRSGLTSVKLVSPDGDFFKFSMEFGRYGWRILVETSEDTLKPPWPLYFGERPDNDLDPAIIIDVPEGTVAFVDGSPVS